MIKTNKHPQNFRNPWWIQRPCTVLDTILVLFVNFEAHSECMYRHGAAFKDITNASEIGHPMSVVSCYDQRPACHTAKQAASPSSVGSDLWES